MSTTTGYDPLLLRAQDVAVVCPKARDIDKLLTENIRRRKIAMSVSEERAKLLRPNQPPRAGTDMANNCYNVISFLGNSKVKEQVKAWNIELRKFEPTKEDPHCFRAIRSVFYPELGPEDELDLGSKWVHIDDDSIDSTDDQLGLLSAWSNPSKLQERLACLLYKLDKNVIVRNSFDGEDYSSGVSYTAAFNEAAAYTQTAHVELDQDEFDDIEEAEEDRDLRLARDEVETLTDYFLDDMPHLVKVIKKHLPHLDIDWDQYK